MWEQGHSFEEIRDMSLEDFGNVIGYWSEKGRGEERLAERRSNHKNARARG